MRWVCRRSRAQVLVGRRCDIAMLMKLFNNGRCLSLPRLPVGGKFRFQHLAEPFVVLALVLAGCNSSKPTGTTTTSSSINQPVVRTDGTTRMAEYQVPTLQGWKREAAHKTNDPVQSVRFSKTVAGTKMLTEFVLLPHRQDAAPDTAADLAKSVQDTDRINKEVDPKRGERRQIVLSQARQYQGHPAYMTHELLRNRTRVTELKILRVADGRNTFWFFQSSVGAGLQIPAAARAAATQAWQAMTNSFK